MNVSYLGVVEYIKPEGRDKHTEEGVSSAPSSLLVREDSAERCCAGLYKGVVFREP
jgi:hypothetical protein